MGKKIAILDWLSDRLNLTEIFSLLTSYGLFYAELDSSKPLSRALEEALDEPTPSYARWPRVLGLIVVLLIALEILTGGLLALYYLPTPETAHSSLGTILRDVHFGPLFRQIHFWGAQMLIAVLILRVVRFFWQTVYRPPRELVWVFAWLLLLVCFHADLTGRLLPWTADAYWSTVRAIEIADAVPIYGSVLLFLIGGAESVISDLTLVRFYILHIAILPGLAVSLIYLHFSCIRRTGLSGPVDENALPGRLAFRVNFVNMAILLALAFAVLLSLAVLAATPFEAQADPFSTVPGVGPPWYLMAPFGLLELTSGIVPRWLTGLFLFLVTLAVLTVPFWLRPRTEAMAKAGMMLGVVFIILWLALSWYGVRVA
jgi:quinol-cytochrome oxidoreductase complex cytochrome b subunit